MDNAKKIVEQEQKETNIVDVSKFEKGTAIETGIDFNKYDGVKTKISAVEVREHVENGYYLRVISEPLDTIKKDGEDKPLFASRLFSLVKKIDEETKKASLCWSLNGDLQKFLNKYKVEHFEDLVGKTVISVVEIKKDRETLTLQ